MQGAVPQGPPSSVEGDVVLFGSNEPIPMTLVELRRVQTITSISGLPAGLPPGFDITGLVARQQPQPPLTTTTNDAGHFQFASVPPGEYRLYASRANGYTPAEYGQRSPSGEGISIQIDGGRPYSGIRLSMAPTGAIGGRVMLATDEPAVYARVGLMRAAYRDGNPIWIFAEATTTDDRGEYRFYAIPPGKYWISGQPWDSRSTRIPYTSEPTVYPNRFAGQQSMGAPMVIERVLESGQTVEEFIQRVYYPGTSEEKAARTIVVHSGEQVQGIDFSIAGSTVSSRRMRGTILDGESGMPASGAIVRLVPRQLQGAALTIPSTTTGTDGTFEVKGMTNGAYSVLVNFGTGNAYMTIDAGAGDVEGVKLATMKGMDVFWHVTYEEGVVDPAATPLRVALVRDPDIIGPPPVNGVMTAGWVGPPQGIITPQSQSVGDGFVLRNVPPGEYRLRLSNVPDGAYLKSLRRGGEDVLRDGVKILSASSTPIEIVLGLNSGKLDGHVVNKSKQVEGNVPVVLVPAFDRNRGDLYHKVVTDAKGAFRITGVAPGQYKLFSWEDVLDGAWRDPDFLRNYEALGVSVNVEAARSATTEVEVIPWSEGQ
jgi:protocatechuate 3,4-dioxygenase beta subunit